MKVAGVSNKVCLFFVVCFLIICSEYKPRNFVVAIDDLL